MDNVDNSKDQVSDHDQSNAGGKDEGKESVSYEAHSKLLGQRKKDQEKLRELEERLKNFEAEDSKRKEKKLQEEGNFKALLESRDQENSKLKSKMDELNEEVMTYKKTFEETKKLNAFHKAIGGKLKSDKYYKMVDSSKIAIDPDTGEVDEKTVKSYAESFLADHKEIVDFGQAKMPGGSPQRVSFSTDKLTSQNDFKEALKRAMTN